MRSASMIGVISVLPAAVLGAQQNPFTLISDPVESAYVIYELSGKHLPMRGVKAELGVTGQGWAMRMVVPVGSQGERDSVISVVVETPDSVYSSDNAGEVSPSLRPFLAREYAALDQAAKARVRQNLKAAQAFGEHDNIGLMAFAGEKIGLQTIAGHHCEVYRTGKITICVLPEAPTIALSMTSPEGVSLIAREVRLNEELPPPKAILPKGVRFKKRRDFKGGDFALEIWEMKKETDPLAAGRAGVAQFAIRYLASPQAASELKEMRPTENQPAEDDPPDEGEEAGES